jgi:hypothetical protein
MEAPTSEDVEAAMEVGWRAVLHASNSAAWIRAWLLRVAMPRRPGPSPYFCWCEFDGLTEFVDCDLHDPNCVCDERCRAMARDLAQEEDQLRNEEATREWFLEMARRTN